MPNEPLIPKIEEVESSWSHGQKRGPTPLLEEEVIINDHVGAKVLVFPKVKELGGTIDADMMIDKPMELCSNIFRRERSDTFNDGLEALMHGPVNALLYHEVVRAKILEVLQGLGMKVRSFDSIDGDEVFVLIWLDPAGEVIRLLAQRHQYVLPFTQGAYPKGEPMKDKYGRPVVAYTAYELELSDDLETFREIDIIRLMELYLGESLNFWEMHRQGVILHAFTGANYEKAMHLHRTWGSLSKTFTMPKGENIQKVRDYFGEEVAFFFSFFAFYTKMLVFLAFAGFLIIVFQLSGLTKLKQRYLQIFFAFLLIGWASVYNAAFKETAARYRQLWGMKDHEEILPLRESFKPDLQGTLKLRFRLVVARVCPVLYCMLFIGVVAANSGLDMFLRQTGSGLEENKYVSTALLIKIFSVVWNRIAPCLADIQNHRTQTRWNDALIGILGSVKLFVTLYPFMYDAFLKGLFRPYCGRTLEEAVWKVYGAARSWPHGVPIPQYSNETAGVPRGTDLSWLDGYYSNCSTTGNWFCIYGCFPASCFEVKDGPDVGQLRCETNCVIGLEQSLQSVYLVHICVTVAFVLIPIALTRIELEREAIKEKAKGKHFSVLEIQAKCCANASYEYLSWGGSQVEDFLELAIGFALLTCFGIVKPEVSILAWFSHIVEYRLLAYRMTNITCRPFPHSAEGIGTWQHVFEVISMFAIVTNVGLAVTQMYPMRFWDSERKWITFILLEHSLLLVYIVVTYCFPSEPLEVRHIEDFNNAFKRKRTMLRPVEVPAHERCDMDGVEISVVNRWASNRRLRLECNSDGEEYL